MSHKFVGFKALAAAAVVGLGAWTSNAVAAPTPDLSAYGWTAFVLGDNVSLKVLNQAGNTVTLELEKTATFLTLDPVIIHFEQRSASAPTVNTFIIKDETITNDSGTDWTGFRFMLEGSVPGHDPTFNLAGSNNFGATPFTTQTNVDSQTIDLSGGTLPTGPGNSGDVFFPGSPQAGSLGDLVINTNPATPGNMPQNFNFKEMPLVGNGNGGGGTPPPVIPLPAAAWTSLTGLLGLGLISNAKNLKKILS
jgi:hypothetical protein